MPDEPHYINHRKRLRERFRKTGAEGMHDYELPELLLTFFIPRRDVKPVAKKLISEFGGLSGVLDADQKKLEGLSGVDAMSAALIRLVKELYSTYLDENMKKGDLLSSPEAVLKFVRVRLSGMTNEAFMVVYLEDEALTGEIADAAKTLDIRVLDHIIVGKDGYFSFMENGLLSGLKHKS